MLVLIIFTTRNPKPTLQVWTTCSTLNALYILLYVVDKFKAQTSYI